MKNNTWILCTLLLFCLKVKAHTDPKPEKIYSITTIVYPLDYYHEQAGLWKKEISKNQQNADAWSNYYFACRMANILTPYGEEKAYQLDQIVKDIAKAIPNSYEHHYLTYANGGYNPDMFFHLEKAYERIDRNKFYTALVL